MALKDVLKSWLVRLRGWDLTVYICIVIAVAGGFVCGWNNIILWYMLVFHCYTDIKSMELYVLPVRIAIIAETVLLFMKHGFLYMDYRELFLCLAAVIVLRIMRAYAQGDMELFIMLIIAAACGEGSIISYSCKLVYGSLVTFCVSFGVYMAVYNLKEKLMGRQLKKIKKAPMVPSIALSFFFYLLYNMIRVSEHAGLIYECITYYIYTCQLRCPKQDVLRALIKVSCVRH